MRINGIDFPKPLLDAQSSGDLVIFAGAGVSIPAPSSYPNFDDLADRVAAGVPITRDHEEPLDHFLGRLAHRKVDVHTRVRDLLSNPASLPNTLHTDLLWAFGSSERVRLVTTNFDLHFSTAAAGVYEHGQLETHSAPALPVGDKFSGLVYLHGSVNKPANRLILTDSDFGRAYLTEGWARRFLQALFNRYTVLFIGYSYSDIVMNYLTRGLPPDAHARRYALTPLGGSEKWSYLGITPLEYELTRTADNKHIRLVEAVSQWAKVANAGVLERETKIKGIVAGPVPLSIDDQDYIENSLGELATVRFFVRYAEGLDWLHWIEDKSAFARLFRTDVPPTDIDWELACWFARVFVCGHTNSALALIRRKRQSITPTLWSAIALAFHREKPASEVVGKWVPLLIKHPTPASGGDLLEYTLHRSIYPDDVNSALLLFEYLTKPDIILRERWWSEGQEEADERVDIELTTEGDDPWLPGAWRTFFKPHLDVLANRLIWIVTYHLQHAYLLLEAYGKVHPTWDPLSARRGLIESTSQGSPEKGVGILVDIAREILEWSVSGHSRTADQLIDLWFSSDCRILKRLAIFGVSKSAHWSSDVKVRWILQNNLVYSFGYKHEVFLVLEDAYAKASVESRTEVLEQARGGPPALAEDPHAQAYEEYSLLSWLAKSAPECNITQDRLTDIRQQHPEFGPREHPDMDGWIGPVTTGWQSPKGFEEILSKSPEEQLDFLVTFEANDFRGPSREGLLIELSAAVAHDFDWGMRFAQMLVGKQILNPDLLNAVIGGWVTSAKGSQWPVILDFLLNNVQVLDPTMHSVARLLDDGVEKPDRAIPEDSLPAAVALAKATWSTCTKHEEGRQAEAEDWLFVALNRAAGAIALFLLRVLSKTRKALGAEWTGMPADYHEIFSSMITGDSYAAELARIMLASQLLFLFGLDEKWTVNNLVPLFKWSREPRSALQAWHGYLGWGQWNNALLPHMIANYEETFPVMHAEFGEQRHKMCGHLAGIAVLSAIDPLEHGWLNCFLSSVHSEEREMWASSVTTVLQGATEESKRGVWNGWLRRYWHNRIQGVPVPLNGEKAGRMTHWATALGLVFQEAVDAVCAGPPPELKFNHIYYELARSPAPKQHPTAAAKFLLFLLRNQHGQFWGCEDIETIVKDVLSTKPTDKANLLLVCDQLARLGCGNGALLEERGPECVMHQGRPTTALGALRFSPRACHSPFPPVTIYTVTNNRKKRDRSAPG